MTEDFLVIVQEQVNRTALQFVFFSLSIKIGYEDDTCTTEINECLDNPCQNNASCIDQIGGYICACPRGFVGFQCESKVNYICYYLIDLHMTKFCFHLEISWFIGTFFLSLHHMAWNSGFITNINRSRYNYYRSCS